MGYTNRNEIPEKYKWNLGDIFQTPEKWEEAFAAFTKQYRSLVEYKGKLGNKQSLLAFFKANDEVDLKVQQLYCYASMSYNEDSQDAERQSRFGRMYSLLTDYSEALSFVSPELSSQSVEYLNGLLSDPDFAD